MATKAAAKKAKAPSFDSIEEELLEVTGEKAQGRKEERGAFLTRIANAIDGLDDDEYEKLSEEAQAWFEKAAKAVTKDKAPAEFPDAEAKDEEEGEEADAEEEEEEEKVSAKKPAAKGKAVKARPATKKSKSKGGGSDHVRGNRGIGAFCKELILKKKSTDEIISAVKKKWPDASTTPASISWYRGALRAEGKRV